MTPADRSALTCIATGIHWCLLSIVQFSNKALAPFVHPQLVPLHDKYPISSEGGLTSRYGYPKWSANGPTNDSLLLFAFNIIQPSIFMGPISSYSVRLKDWVTPWKGELTSWGKDNPGMSVFNPDLVRLRNHLQENCFSQVLVPDHKRRSE